MNEILKTAVGILIPFLGTVFGSCFVFFLKGDVKPGVQKLLLGFASGVMIAASVWSLIIPAIEMSESQGVIPWLPAAVGFITGIAFLLLLDSVIPHLHLGSDCPEGKSCGLGKSTMLVLAVTLHNLPEGMAVGVVFAGALSGETVISAAAAFALAARNSSAERAGGGGDLDAAAGSGHEPGQGVRDGGALGRGRTDRRAAHHPAYRADDSGAAVHTFLCRRQR